MRNSGRSLRGAAPNRAGHVFETTIHLEHKAQVPIRRLDGVVMNGTQRAEMFRVSREGLNAWCVEARKKDDRMVRDSERLDRINGFGQCGNRP